MTHRFVPFLFGFLAVLSCRSLQAQDWRKNFPDAEAAYTSLLKEVIIKESNGQLVATSNFTEDLALGTDKAVQMMSRGRIYHSSFNELKKWDAYTQLQQSKKIKVANATTSSSRQESIFYDDTKATSFDFAGVSVGALRHVEYELQHKDVHLLMPHYFERYFPVLKGELRIVFPSSVRVKYVLKGVHADKIQFTETKKKDKTTYSFTVTDLPGSQHYPDAPDDSYYATHVVFYIEQVEQGGQWKNFLSSVDDLYRYNYGFIRNSNQNVSAELQAITDSLTRDITTDGEKARRIYRWVQEHIKYVAFEDGLEGFIPREASLVCSRRFGDCKDMASILTVMLRRAGIPAYFTWIGTRNLPYKYSELPLPIVDNHMICTIKINGEYLFLDGTDNGCVFGYPSDAIQGKEALIALSENEYAVATVPVLTKQQNTYTDSTLLEFSNGTLKGRLNIRLTGYYASNMFIALNYKNEKEREEFLQKHFSRAGNKVKWSNWNIWQSPDRNETKITADVELPDYAKKAGEEWLLNLNPFKRYEHEEIDVPKRKIPVANDYLQTTSLTTRVRLPQGYKITYLPKSARFHNETGGFSLAYTAEDGFISLTQTFETEQLLLYPDQFASWNKVLEHLFPHYKQSVVLSKQ